MKHRRNRLARAMAIALLLLGSLAIVATRAFRGYAGASPEVSAERPAMPRGDGISGPANLRRQQLAADSRTPAFALRIHVIDEKDGAIAGARVSLEGTGPSDQPNETDDTGWARLNAQPGGDGTFTVVVTKEGYRSKTSVIRSAEGQVVLTKLKLLQGTVKYFDGRSAGEGAGVIATTGALGDLRSSNLAQLETLGPDLLKSAGICGFTSTDSNGHYSLDVTGSEWKDLRVAAFAHGYITTQPERAMDGTSSLDLTLNHLFEAIVEIVDPSGQPPRLANVLSGGGPRQYGCRGAEPLVGKGLAVLAGADPVLLSPDRPSSTQYLLMTAPSFDIELKPCTFAAQWPGYEQAKMECTMKAVELEDPPLYRLELAGNPEGWSSLELHFLLPADDQLDFGAANIQLKDIGGDLHTFPVRIERLPVTVTNVPHGNYLWNLTGPYNRELADGGSERLRIDQDLVALEIDLRGTCGMRIVLRKSDGSVCNEEVRMLHSRTAPEAMADGRFKWKGASIEYLKHSPHQIVGLQPGDEFLGVQGADAASFTIVRLAAGRISEVSLTVP